MAKKKNDELQYGQMPLPQAQNSSTRLKVNWSGLNKRQVIDTGVLSMENNISTMEAPYLTPSQQRRNILDGYNYPISMFGFDGFLVVIYRESSKVKLDYIVLNKNGTGVRDIYTGLVKTGVDSDTDVIQRSMVQFNVYESAVDVLDGEYVKKLLLFPDKVSMYMKIVSVSENPNSLYEKGEITALDVMYCFVSGTNKRYYVWRGEEFEQIGGSNYFSLDSLDVVVKNYYNDGYEKSSDKNYNDGYKRIDKNYYNDGFKPTEYTEFYDGYARITSGTYDSEDDTVYFERIGDYSPYTYIVAVLEDGDSLRGLYRRPLSPLSKITNTTFYERSGMSYPYTYTVVKDLDYGRNVSNYYEKAQSSQYPITNTTLYKRTPNKYPYEYTKVTGLEYGDNISTYYEKVSDKEIEKKAYYKRSGSLKPYTYTAVSGLDYGDSVSKYYIKTDDYSPPEGSSTNCYWKNSFNNDCYRYSNDTGEGKGGFAVAIPPAFPNLKYAAVHLSRLFGVDNDRVHVSGFNDYSNWNLDTATESNESNAWCSAAQSNTKANGEFTGLTVYDNHVVCFKHDFMHEIYNNKNPFRLVDIYAEGTIDNRSIQEVDGKLIFVSDDEVKVYTGSNPRVIGYYLGIDTFTAAVSGSDGRNYYLYCEDDSDNKYLFVYDTFVGQWSEQTVDFSVIGFTHNKNGMFMLTDGGTVYKMDTGKYNIDWSFETDISTALTSSSSSSYQTVNIKHISKFQMLAYIEGDMKIYALYDNEVFDSETSQLLYDSNGKTGMQPIRLKPRMTANYSFKLHFEGHGYVRLYEMELRVVAGGELYV